MYSGQPIALVVAEDFGVANYAASLVRIEYEVETHRTDLNLARNDAYVPPKKRFGMSVASPRGDARGAFEKAPIRVENEYGSRSSTTTRWNLTPRP